MKKSFLLIPLLVFLFASSAEAAPPNDTCPVPVSAGDVPGTVGAAGVKGYTVVQGQTVEEFDVEILAIENGYPLPGDQMIVARASGAPITASGGGISYGMSGSPIYLSDGRLLGALAYGFSWSPSPIFGITPAAQMTSQTPPAARVPLSEKTTDIIKGETGRAGAALEKLPIVLSSSVPLRGPATEEFRAQAEKRGLLLRSGGGSLLRGIGRGSVSPTPGATLGAGGVVTASFAVGRTSFTGLGTTTYVCGDKFLAFGHPFLADNSARAVISQGTVFTTVVDQVGGPYKFGGPTNPVGTMTLDNDYAIGGTLGTATPTIDFNVSLRNMANGGAFYGLATQVPKMSNGGDTGAYVTPYVGGAALSSEIMKLLGSGLYATGSGFGGWTIGGTANGEPFSWKYSDAWAGYTADIGAPFVSNSNSANLWSQLSAIMNYALENPAENIQIESVDSAVDLYPEIQTWELQQVQWKYRGKRWRGSSEVKGVPRGKKFAVRVLFRGSDGGSLTRVLRFRKKGSTAAISISKSQITESSSETQSGPSSLAELFQSLEGQSNNKLNVFTSGAKQLSGSLQLDRVVSGEAFLDVKPYKKKSAA